MRKRKTVCWALLGLVIAAPFAFAEEQASVSRLPPLPQPLDPILQEMFDKRRAMGGAIINLTLTTGHAPKFARASGAMAFAIRFETSTPRRLIELVIFRTAQIVGSDYELNQHRPLMKMCGYSDQQIAERRRGPVVPVLFVAVPGRRARGGDQPSSTKLCILLWTLPPACSPGVSAFLPTCLLRRILRRILSAVPLRALSSACASSLSTCIQAGLLLTPSSYMVEVA
jgi:Carboxymuconolactone decarboxylase family